MDLFKHGAVFEIQSGVFIRQNVVSGNTYFAPVGNGYLDFILGSIDSYDVEGDEFFTVVEFEFREIILFCLSAEAEVALIEHRSVHWK